MSRRIGFFGSPGISAELLKHLIQEGFSVSFAVSNEDRPRGRSGTPVPTEVSRAALEAGIPLFRFDSIRKPENFTQLQKYPCDAFVVFAYGKILPDEIISMPETACLNLHGSLLPLLRGASPVQSAVLNGFSITGWSVQTVTKALDAGDVLATWQTDILEDETAGELMERILPEGIKLMTDVLNHLDEKLKNRIPQEEEKATVCRKITTEMSRIDWNRPAPEIHNAVRAFNPAPGARTGFRGKNIRILHSHIPSAEEAEEMEKLLKGSLPGSLMAWNRKKRLMVLTGSGILEITELQPENKKAMDPSAFLNGYRIGENDRFETES